MSSIVNFLNKKIPTSIGIIIILIAALIVGGTFAWQYFQILR